MQKDIVVPPHPVYFLTTDHTVGETLQLYEKVKVEQEIQFRLNSMVAQKSVSRFQRKKTNELACMSQKVNQI